LDIGNNQEIIDFCNKEINKLGLTNKIIFESIKPSKRTDEKLRKLVNTSNFDVIVWTPKPPKNGRVPLYFTYKNSVDNLIAKIVHSDIHNMQMKDKAFNIQNESLTVDLNIERNNIAHFSLYIVALITTIFRGRNEGIEVFEKLYEEVKELNTVINKITKHKLKDLYIINGVELFYKRRYDDAQIYLEKAYPLDPLDQNLLPVLSIIKYHEGDFPLSEELSLTLLHNHPTNKVAHLNVAFFKIRNRRYGNALKHYRRFLRSEPEPKTCLDAITFLSEVFDANPSEIGYLFGRGFIKKIIGKNDDKIGESTYVQDFTAFLSRANTIPEYRNMVEYATIAIRP
jgi:tetratricopeptide (TPR) repeat protein